MDIHQTIAAIATAPGEGAIAIVRMSGNEALSIAAKLFSVPLLKSHVAYYGKILGANREILDHALAICMKAPHSYTGEDIVELHCHGGSFITKRILERCLEAGAVTAEPGAFTFRAFMHGKMDLAQAEAVQALISAKSAAAMSHAKNQLEGSISKKVLLLQDKLFGIAAILEAWVDFPEEGIEFASLEDVSLDLRLIKEEIEAFAATFHEGKVLYEGLTLCLIGAPNVGKSSLMNALLRKERAIVTPIAGTTRDILEDQMQIGDLSVRLLDTAGLRETEEIIEQEGIKRSKNALQEADLVLLVLDASRTLLAEEESLIKSLLPEKTLLIWNKCDLRSDIEGVLKISALQGTGLDKLKEAILAKITYNSNKDEVLITALRHKEALDKSAQSLSHVIQGLQEGTSPEFLTSDLKESLQHLTRIIGKDISEEVLSAIFSRFCIGK
ncbi:MAG: tRNA uridine-5-carboxymethylaminomethyl(34) synthesis GTPase MnmE [Chlamydiae bacterium]|nr:tRNA uridine-5-carboxymethylaminomethyl(34) synthesis GTPase MnmE [Chlamydiota bacterium]